MNFKEGSDMINDFETGLDKLQKEQPKLELNVMRINDMMSNLEISMNEKLKNNTNYEDGYAIEQFKSIQECKFNGQILKAKVNQIKQDFKEVLKAKD